VPAGLTKRAIAQVSLGPSRTGFQRRQRLGRNGRRGYRRKVPPPTQMLPAASNPALLAGSTGMENQMGSGVVKGTQSLARHEHDLAVGTHRDSVHAVRHTEERNVKTLPSACSVSLTGTGRRTSDSHPITGMGGRHRGRRQLQRRCKTSHIDGSGGVYVSRMGLHLLADNVLYSSITRGAQLQYECT
jgi:hypothetical protein